MPVRNRKTKMRDNDSVEQKLMRAIQENDAKKVGTFLDILCRTEKSQSLAAYKAREFLREQKKQKRR